MPRTVGLAAKMDNDGVGLIVLSKDQVEQLQEKLKPLVPDSLTVLGLCKSILAGVVDREVMVDKWPDFAVLVDRHTPGHSGSGLKRLESAQCVFTTSSDEKLLEEFFLRPGVVNWHLPEVVMQACPLEVKGAIKRAAEKKGRKVSVKRNSLTYFLSSKDPSPQFQIPPGYTLSCMSLDEETAVTVASEWDGGDGEKTPYADFVLKNFPSVAIRETETGALVGYYLQHWVQAMGFLYVKEEHRGKGLGKFLVVEKARQCFQNGDHVVFIYIMSDNKASCTLHEKCGFKKGGYVEWLVIEPDDK